MVRGSVFRCSDDACSPSGVSPRATSICSHRDLAGSHVCGRRGRSLRVQGLRSCSKRSADYGLADFLALPTTRYRLMADWWAHRARKLCDGPRNSLRPNEKSACNLATRKRFLASLRVTKPAGPRNRPGSLIIVEELHFVIGFESGYWLLPGRAEERSAVGNREWVLSRVHGLV